MPQARYDRLYVYSDKDHPKRGNRYGQHFRIVRHYRDIRDVIWPDGSKGYVREGEYVTLQQWNLDEYGTERQQLTRRAMQRTVDALRDEIEKRHRDHVEREHRKLWERINAGIRELRERHHNAEQTDYLHSVAATLRS